MEVQLKFNTETESLEDLNKLKLWVEDLISKRKSSGSLEAKERPIQKNPKQGKTSGSSSVVPYEDMSRLLSKIASGEKIR